MQSYQLLLTIDLQAEVAHIPADLHLHWYTGGYGVSSHMSRQDLMLLFLILYRMLLAEPCIV